MAEKHENVAIFRACPKARIIYFSKSSIFETQQGFQTKKKNETGNHSELVQQDMFKTWKINWLASAITNQHCHIICDAHFSLIFSFPLF